MFSAHASHVTMVDNELTLAEHSLRCQSQCDLTKRDHSDGWGVAGYRGDRLEVHRGASAAYGDEAFTVACNTIRSRVIFAHVRKASKGAVNLSNTHPFTRGRWMFMHNGTLTALESLQESLHREIPATMRASIRGSTDSELIFYWVLRRLQLDRAIDDDRCVSLQKMRLSLAASLAELDWRNNLAEAAQRGSQQAKLNWMLTNGSVTVGTRLRNSLFSLQETRLRPTGHSREAIFIASEPLDGRHWQEIPEGSTFSISSRIGWTVRQSESYA